MKINFVYDQSNPLHITKRDFVQKIGVSQSTINKKSKEIMDLLDISILSQEWFVEGNEEFTMSNFLEGQSRLLEFNKNIALLFEEDNADCSYEEIEDCGDEEEIIKQELFKSIESEDINTLDEEELEVFIELCLNVIGLIIDEIQEGFEDEDCYYERFDQAELILNKANNASIKIHKINKYNTKPYFDVQYMMAEMCMEGNDFETALQKYEYIKEFCPNYERPVKYKIFNIRYYANDDVEMYLKSFDEENNAMWDYNRALYNYSISNELMAIKYLKEALRKNNIIAALLLDDTIFDINGYLSPLEAGAVAYYMSSKCIWMETEGALEWLFYKKQELKK